jgi:addiction module HigA family antidote
MPVRNPPHPGGIVRRQCLAPLGLSVTDAAKGLGITRQALSDLVNERAGVSVEMAIRLSKAFGSSPETWLGLQTAYDLWQARGRGRAIKVRAFKPRRPPRRSRFARIRGSATVKLGTDRIMALTRGDG